ncbi:MAG: M20 family metallopeptidase [Chloroflexales bacterium]|nr:M20 family metallopeptidase [Chloroflexales bacterium]
MLKQAEALYDELVRLRRDIHAHPELGFQERRTSALVVDTLNEIGGVEVRTGVGITGVVGEISNGSGPTIAIRADMDALPIIEQSAESYVSTNAGVMHACGHDAHTAILLGTAHLLRERFAAENLKGRVRLLFQPSEEAQDAEGLSGASRMINDGALDSIDAVIALHVDSTAPVGQVTVREGWLTAAVDSFEAWITASGGHGAYPHNGADPLWMLIPVLSALHGIVARRVNPMQPAVVSLGQIHSGATSNVIPAEVYMQGTLRSFDPEVRDQLIAEVEKALAVARALGGDYRMEVLRGYPAGWNDARVAGWMEQTTADLLGSAAVDKQRSGMGGEDFAYMCQKAPGAMIMLGAAIDDGIVRGHHTPIFDIDERCMPMGAAILAETALRFLRGELGSPKEA